MKLSAIYGIMGIHSNPMERVYKEDGVWYKREKLQAYRQRLRERESRQKQQEKFVKIKSVNIRAGDSLSIVDEFRNWISLLVFFKYTFVMRPRFVDIVYETKKPKVILDTQHSPKYHQIQRKVDDGECTYLTSQCIDNKPRIIEGVTVTAPCWREKYTYGCSKIVEDSKCRSLRKQRCIHQGSKDQTFTTGNTRTITKTYKCPSTIINPASKRFVVGGSGKKPYCLAGDCVNPPVEENDEFAEVMSQVGAVAGMEKDGKVVHGQVKEIMGGQNLKCIQKTVWRKDFCLLRGKLNKAAQPDEQKLQKMRQKNLCHYIGYYKERDDSHDIKAMIASGTAIGKLVYGIAKYTATYGQAVTAGVVVGGSLLTLVKDTHKAFCCFNSTFALALNKAARDQGIKSWGTARRPNCSGLTPQELQRLDFDQIDFSDFYEAVTKQAKGKIDTDALVRMTKRRMTSIASDQAAKLKEIR